MSLIVAAWHVHPDYPLIVCANREEFHSRAVDPARWLEQAPETLAAYDADADDVWLGVSRGGRFAAVTCYRGPKPVRAVRRSRGELVPEFLRAAPPTVEGLRALQERGRRYDPFSMLACDGRALGWFSNRLRGVRVLDRGVHALSNHLLGTPWPRVKSARATLEDLVRGDNVTQRDLLGLLSDRERAPDHALPHTGIGIARERWLSPRFVVGDAYGTRSSTVIRYRIDGHVDYLERTFDARGVATATVVHEFDAGAALAGPGNALDGTRSAAS